MSPGRTPSKSPDKSTGGNKKILIKNTGTKIYYSDKSESSVEDLMDETPSNYNIPNGRLDGKSIGYRFGPKKSKKGTKGLKVDTESSPKKNFNFPDKKSRKKFRPDNRFEKKG